MTKSYLSLELLDKSFERGGTRTEVLKQVSLTVDKGEFISIIGHSGCGKSTLLNIVGGLTQATTGVVLLDGKVVDEPGPARRRLPEPLAAAVAHGLRKRPAGRRQGVFENPQQAGTP